MTDLTSILNISFWILDATFLLFLLFYCPIFVFANTRLLNVQNTNILNFFKALLPKDFAFINKKIQKISIKSYLLVFSLTLLIFPILIAGFFFGIVQLAIKEPELRTIKIDKIYYHFIIMGIMILFSVIFFSLSTILILRKNIDFQISEQESLEKFNNFRNDWLLKNGYEKIYFEVDWPRKYDPTSIFGFRFGLHIGVNFKQQKKLKRLKWIRKMHPYNYEYYYLQSFRYYLLYMSTLIRTMYLSPPSFRGTASLEKEERLLHMEELKFAVIQNYLSTLDEFWATNKIT